MFDLCPATDDRAHARAPPPGLRLGVTDGVARRVSSRQDTRVRLPSTAAVLVVTGAVVALSWAACATSTQPSHADVTRVQLEEFSSALAHAGMSVPVILEEDAQAEFDEAFDWYDARSAAKAARFASTVRRVFRRISVNPRTYGIVALDIRKGVVQGFPYCVYHYSKYRTNGYCFTHQQNKCKQLDGYPFGKCG